MDQALVAVWLIVVHGGAGWQDLQGCFDPSGMDAVWDGEITNEQAIMNWPPTT